MAIEKREVEICKEADDLLALVIKLVKDLKAKKAIALIAAEDLPLAVTAMSGLEQIGEEAKNEEALFRTVGARVGELVQALKASA